MSFIRRIFSRLVSAPILVADDPWVHEVSFPFIQPLPHKPEISQADAAILRKMLKRVHDELDTLLDEMDEVHGQLHLRGRWEAAAALKAPISELSAYRYGVALRDFRVEANRK